ncbi:hypothetical protein LZ30DRAFT_385508 [Colletotrichum cereale]|nr:hypothetical protein LZ30DRAFT_385508 [Colletotrichum cereale]
MRAKAVSVSTTCRHDPGCPVPRPTSDDTSTQSPQIPCTTGFHGHHGDAEVLLVCLRRNRHGDTGDPNPDYSLFQTVIVTTHHRAHGFPSIHQVALTHVPGPDHNPIPPNDIQGANRIIRNQTGGSGVHPHGCPKGKTLCAPLQFYIDLPTHHALSTCCR